MQDINEKNSTCLMYKETVLESKWFLDLSKKFGDVRWCWKRTL